MDAFSPAKQVDGLCDLLGRIAIDDEQVDGAIGSISDALAERQQISVDGEGRSFNVAQSLKSMLRGFGGEVYSAKEPPVYRKGARYLAISGSGATTGPLNRIKLADSTGLETMLITEDGSRPKNEMAKISDYKIELLRHQAAASTASSDWLANQLSGNPFAPMGTLFEEAAFLVSVLVAINVADRFRGVDIPKLRTILDEKSFGRQYKKLIFLIKNGGDVDGSHVSGLVEEADSAAVLVKQLYESGNSNPEVLVSGEGVVGHILEMFAQRLYHIEFRAHTTGGTIVPPIKTNTLVLTVSRSGQSSVPVTTADIAIKKNAKLFGITSFRDSPLGRLCGPGCIELSALNYASRKGFEERRFQQRLLGSISADLVDPVFVAKQLILLDAIVAKEMELAAVTEEKMKQRHQQDKAVYL